MWKKIVPSGVFGAFWAAERVIGLAGFPDDVQKVGNLLAMIPDWIGLPALTAFFIFSWQAWGGQVRSTVKHVLGRARSKIKIGSTEYLSFDNFLDVVSAIDMRSLDDGSKYGDLPEGTRIVITRNRSVRLALPVNLGPISVSAGTPVARARLADLRPRGEDPYVRDARERERADRVKADRLQADADAYRQELRVAFAKLRLPKSRAGKLERDTDISTNSRRHREEDHES